MITWLLDLDNTLHDCGAAIMPRINRDMTAFVARELQLTSDEASAVRVQYWRRYGATLLGMIRHHDIDPHAFLRESHQFPDLHQLVRRRQALIDMLRRLRGRKILLTNAPRDYAHGVLQHLGIAPLLTRVVCIEDMRFAGRWQPKPSVAMMRRLHARLRIDPRSCVLVEDSIDNLLAAKRCAMRTVWVRGWYRQTANRIASQNARQHAGKPAVPKSRIRRHPAVDFQIQSVLTLTRIAINH